MRLIVYASKIVYVESKIMAIGEKKNSLWLNESCSSNLIYTSIKRRVYSLEQRRPHQREEQRQPLNFDKRRALYMWYTLYSPDFSIRSLFLSFSQRQLEQRGGDNDRIEHDSSDTSARKEFTYTLPAGASKIKSRRKTGRELPSDEWMAG